MRDKYANCRNKKKVKWILRSDYTRLFKKDILGYGSGTEMRYNSRSFYLCQQTLESKVIGSLLDTKN